MVSVCVLAVAAQSKICQKKLKSYFLEILHISLFVVNLKTSIIDHLFSYQRVKPVK